MGTYVIVGFQFCPVDFPLECEREMILCFTPYIRYQNDTQRWISEGYVVQSFLPADLTLLLLPLKGSRKGGTSGCRKHHASYLFLFYASLTLWKMDDHHWGLGIPNTKELKGMEKILFSALGAKNDTTCLSILCKLFDLTLQFVQISLFPFYRENWSLE